jgi:ferrous iron transport protein A
MRENRIRNEAHGVAGLPATRREAQRMTKPTTYLDQLPDGTHAIVARVVSASPEVDAVALRRLGELGFLPGEPVQVLRRGPGGREPLAVLVGETLFALRRLEAQCVEVRIEVPAETGNELDTQPGVQRPVAFDEPGVQRSATPEVAEA